MTEESNRLRLNANLDGYGGEHGHDDEGMVGRLRPAGRAGEARAGRRQPGFPKWPGDEGHAFDKRLPDRQPIHPLPMKPQASGGLGLAQGDRQLDEPMIA